MILTGNEIKRRILSDDIFISPYSEEFVEPNSYGVHLGGQIIEYSNPVIDAKSAPDVIQHDIPEEGFTLMPDRFYLSHTEEIIGGRSFASELYANLSTALCGIFIQTSAQLGHSGAIISWTLEIVVSHPVIVYRGMPIGKVCFWKNFGPECQYQGRYISSTTVVPSRIAMDLT
jgi:dCTP deaminase